MINQISSLDDSKKMAGSCGVVVFFLDNYIFIGNTGDSRVIISLENGKNLA